MSREKHGGFPRQYRQRSYGDSKPDESLRIKVPNRTCAGTGGNRVREGGVDTLDLFSDLPAPKSESKFRPIQEGKRSIKEDSTKIAADHRRDESNDRKETRSRSDQRSERKSDYSRHDDSDRHDRDCDRDRYRDPWRYDDHKHSNESGADEQRSRDDFEKELKYKSKESDHRDQRASRTDRDFSSKNGSEARKSSRTGEMPTQKSDTVDMLSAMRNQTAVQEDPKTPLKSILKSKKSEELPVPEATVSGLGSLDNSWGKTVTSSIPGLGGGVDMEDEDEFLYGDKYGSYSKSEKSGVVKSPISQHQTQYSTNEYTNYLNSQTLSANPVPAPEPTQPDATNDAPNSGSALQNILKSNGFDFIFSKLMQVKAKQESGELGMDDVSTSSTKTSAVDSSIADASKSSKVAEKTFETYAEQVRGYREEADVARTMGRQSPPPFTPQVKKDSPTRVPSRSRSRSSSSSRSRLSSKSRHRSHKKSHKSKRHRRRRTDSSDSHPPLGPATDVPAIPAPLDPSVLPTGVPPMRAPFDPSVPPPNLSVPSSTNLGVPSPASNLSVPVSTYGVPSPASNLSVPVSTYGMPPPGVMYPPNYTVPPSGQGAYNPYQQYPAPYYDYGSYNPPPHSQYEVPPHEDPYRAMASGTPGEDFQNLKVLAAPELAPPSSVPQPGPPPLQSPGPPHVQQPGPHPVQQPGPHPVQQPGPHPVQQPGPPHVQPHGPTLYHPPLGYGVPGFGGLEVHSDSSKASRWTELPPNQLSRSRESSREKDLIKRRSRSRETSWEREYKSRGRDRSRSRGRSWSRGRSRDRSRSRDWSRERRRSQSRDRSRSRNRGWSRGRSRDRSRSRGRNRDRSRSRDRSRERSRRGRKYDRDSRSLERDRRRSKEGSSSRKTDRSDSKDDLTAKTLQAAHLPEIPGARSKSTLSLLRGVIEKKSEKEAPKETLEETERRRESHLREQQERKQKIEGLALELKKVRRQGEKLMRKKKKHKNGFNKDQQILENSQLQEDIAMMIKSLKAELDDSPPQNTEERKTTSLPLSSKHMAELLEKLNPENEKAAQEKKMHKVKKEVEVRRTIRMDKREVEYLDPGNHWCKLCNELITNVFGVFEHLQTKEHKHRMDRCDRPWLATVIKKEKEAPGGHFVTEQMKGVEFMMPVPAFFCKLCSVVSVDMSGAEEHLKTDSHNEKFREYIDENPHYERNYQLEKAAGLSLHTFEANEPTRVQLAGPRVELANLKDTKQDTDIRENIAFEDKQTLREPSPRRRIRVKETERKFRDSPPRKRDRSPSPNYRRRYSEREERERPLRDQSERGHAGQPKKGQNARRQWPPHATQQKKFKKKFFNKRKFWNKKKKMLMNQNNAKKNVYTWVNPRLGTNFKAEANPRTGENSRAGANPRTGENTRGGVNPRVGENTRTGANSGTGENSRAGGNPRSGENSRARANSGIGEKSGTGENSRAGVNPMSREDPR